MSLPSPVPASSPRADDPKNDDKLPTFAYSVSFETPSTNIISHPRPSAGLLRLPPSRNHLFVSKSLDSLSADLISPLTNSTQQNTQTPVNSAATATYESALSPSSLGTHPVNQMSISQSQSADLAAPSSSSSLQQQLPMTPMDHPDHSDQPQAGGVESPERDKDEPKEQQKGGGWVGWWRNYFSKWAGNPKAECHRHETWSSRIQSFVYTFIAIAILGLINFVGMNDTDLDMLEASFGASSVLLYTAFTSPLAQPRNAFFGHSISAFIGVCWQKIFTAFGDPYGLRWLSAALAISTSVLVCSLLDCSHPPGGAAAGIAILGSAKVKKLGFLFVIFPIMLGSLITILLALIFNNLFSDRRYPQKWF